MWVINEKGTKTVDISEIEKDLIYTKEISNHNYALIVKGHIMGEYSNKDVSGYNVSRILYALKERRSTYQIGTNK